MTASMTTTTMNAATTTATTAATAKLLSYPLNAWYPAGWDHEVTAQGHPGSHRRGPSAGALPHARRHTPSHSPMRAGTGSPRCRRAKLVGRDEIQCPYHGLRLQLGGALHSMPAQETLNPSRYGAVVPGRRSATATCGSGWATRRSRTRNSCRHAPVGASEEWAGDGDTIPRRATTSWCSTTSWTSPTRSSCTVQRSGRRSSASPSSWSPTKEHRHRDAVDAQHRRPAVLAQEHA